MNDEILKAISNKLTVLIRLYCSDDSKAQLKISDILEMVKDMNLTDIEVGAMFGTSPQVIRNARSKSKKAKK